MIMVLRVGVSQLISETTVIRLRQLKDNCFLKLLSSKVHIILVKKKKKLKECCRFKIMPLHLTL